MFRIQMQTTEQMLSEIRTEFQKATGKTFSDDRIIQEALKCWLDQPVQFLDWE